jgi:hypothetical protein
MHHIALRIPKSASMTSSALSSSALPVDSSDNEECYEPEYELECFTIEDRYSIRLLAVVPPPLEYMMSLHSAQQEISGRQVWCGSLLLAHALVQLVSQEDPDYFKSKRLVNVYERVTPFGPLGVVL